MKYSLLCAGLFAASTSAQAVIIFAEDFEAATATTAQSATNAPISDTQVRAENTATGIIAITTAAPGSALTGQAAIFNATRNFSIFSVGPLTIPAGTGRTYTITFDALLTADSDRAPFLGSRTRFNDGVGTNAQVTDNSTQLGAVAAGEFSVVLTAAIPDSAVEFTPSFIIDAQSGDNLVEGIIEIDNIVVEVVPEPSSTLLLGLAGLALVRRRR